MVKKALIIAAGNGSRLQRGGRDLPKPLQKVAGLPLIKRIVLSAKRVGIEEFVVVVGYQKEKIIEALKGEELGVKIEFVENPDWKKPNGVSVLAARPFLKENFVLLMSDHIFDPRTLQKLKGLSLTEYQAILAVDYKIRSIFDLDDATKVSISEGKVTDIGKNLTRYDAIDTGMFLVNPKLFQVLEEAKKDGACSLSDGIQLLASRGEMGTFDIGEAFWQDVDTEPTLKHAEKILLNSCRKPTDGFISRHFNRHISLFISRFLVKTPLSANQITGLTTLVGFLSAFFTSRGDYLNVVLGAFLFKLTSILDGCDGEVSKLKLSDSKLGQWLDTISDNFTYFIYIIGVIFGLARVGSPHIMVMGTFTLFGLSMTLFVMFYYLIRYTNSGSLVTIQKDFQKKGEDSLLKRFVGTVQFMIKRDFFALFFFVLAVMGELNLILWISLIGSNVTWIVLLNSRLGLLKPAVVTEESPDAASR